ncbi:hypothetical protein BDZ90DRAFT_232057 [Jaminaea rosea]|uniref:Uncharacterized protein n=1 Tax=Jaminaea rosea TaxID=1569628 RepID=A0A316UQR2_9BASI|nr:hypothetical protein BDZ90DRAFT_232057 [Jaminaea rosea]PWN27636.1 hypothetical protein BDZ90DRAFT_232057 [Jaminaea rosea]
MKTFALLSAVLAVALSVQAAPQPTSVPLIRRNNALSPRQGGDASALLSSVRASPDAFMSSVTASDKTTAFSSATGFACKGLQRGNDRCCETGILVNGRCFVVPGAEGLNFYGNTDDYVPGEDDDNDSSSSSSAAAPSSTGGSSSSSSSSGATPTQASSSASSAAAAAAPTASSQSGGSNAAIILDTNVGLMVASFLGLAVVL